MATIVDITPPSPQPGDSVVIALADAVNAAGKTVTYGGISVSLDSQDINSITLTWPVLQTFGAIDYNTDYTLLVVDDGNNPAQQVTTLPAAGYGHFAIADVGAFPALSIFADDTGIEAGDTCYGHAVAGTVDSMADNGVAAGVSNGAQYQYWIFDTSLQAWSGPVTETFSVYTIPNITGIGATAVSGATATVTGSQFGAVQGSVLLSAGGYDHNCTITSWAAGGVTFDIPVIETGRLAYGGASVTLYDDSGNNDTTTTVIIPAGDNDAVTITAPAADPATRIETDGDDLAAGDQVRFSTVLSQGGSPTAYWVRVLDDGTVEIDPSAPNGSYTFAIAARNADGGLWSDEAVQSLGLLFTGKASAVSGGGDIVSALHKSIFIASPISGGGASTVAARKNALLSRVVSGGGATTSTVQAIQAGGASSSVSGGGAPSSVVSKNISLLRVMSGGGENSSSVIAAAGNGLVSVINGGGSSAAAVSKASNLTTTISGSGVVSLQSEKAVLAVSLVAGGGAVLSSVIMQGPDSVVGISTIYAKTMSGRMIEITEGDDHIISVSANDSIVGMAEIVAVVARIKDNKKAVITKRQSFGEVVVMSASELRITLDSADSVGLHGVYYLQITLTDAFGEQKSIILDDGDDIIQINKLFTQ